MTIRSFLDDFDLDKLEKVKCVTWQELKELCLPKPRVKMEDDGELPGRRDALR